MTPEVFAEWFRRQGHQVVQTESSYWVEAGPRTLQAFPYHWLISPSQDELDLLLRDQAYIGLRYSTTWEGTEGAASYHVVFTEKVYPLSVLPQKTRPDVRRVMRRARFEPISFDRLAGEGWTLRAETLQRQGREGIEDQEWWERLCQSANGLPGFEAWGIIVEGRLAASLLVFFYADCCNALYHQSRTEYLSLGVNNALLYEFTNEILMRSGNPWIFYGLHSLDAPPGVDRFKFLMRYCAKPVRQRVIFHPWLRPLVNPASHALLRLGRKSFPGNPRLAKAEGMLRFYLQGKLPLAEQVKPEPLQNLVLS